MAPLPETSAGRLREYLRGRFGIERRPGSEERVWQRLSRGICAADLLSRLHFRGSGALELRLIQMWSAAASSGEEAHTMARTALEALGPGTAENVSVLASDISRPVLASAARGEDPAAALEPPPGHAECAIEVPHALTQASQRVWLARPISAGRPERLLRKDAE